MKQFVGASILAVLIGASAANAQDSGASTAARMVDAEGKSAGTVTFNQTKSGMLHVIVEMTGIEPGPHGFHVHETGACDAGDGFKSAGGHYAGDKEHGVGAPNGPHPGDFPNVNVGPDGVLKTEFFTDRLTLDREGENPLLDDDGSAVVVHGNQDDYFSQPSGEAGPRIACGVVE